VTAWESLHARLLVILPTLSGWGACTVYDGEPVGQDNPTAYFTLAHVRDIDGGGGLHYEEAGDGFGDYETGTIRSELVVWGDEDTTAACRSTAFALFEAFRVYVRDNRWLGALTNGAVTLAADVIPVVNDEGAAYALVVTASYSTRIT
jgi:hypothetical protein